MNISPIQNVGSENVTSDAVTQPVSRSVPLFAATSTPKKIPIKSESKVEVPRRMRVLVRRPVAIMSSKIGWPDLKETPKLKVSMLKKYFPKRSQGVASTQWRVAGLYEEQRPN